MMKTMSLMLMVFSLTACTLDTVNPWDRNVLSKPEMQLDANLINDGFDDHIYFSKEASVGGAGIGGGGCGCN